MMKESARVCGTQDLQRVTWYLSLFVQYETWCLCNNKCKPDCTQIQEWILSFGLKFYAHKMYTGAVPFITLTGKFYTLSYV